MQCVLRGQAGIGTAWCLDLFGFGLSCVGVYSLAWPGLAWLGVVLGLGALWALGTGAWAPGPGLWSLNPRPRALGLGSPTLEILIA